MPEITLTEEQFERLRGVSEDLESVYVGPYGRTDVTDAIDYLLDTYTPPDEADRGEGPPSAASGTGRREPAGEGTSSTESAGDGAGTDSAGGGPAEAGDAGGGPAEAGDAGGGPAEAGDAGGGSADGGGGVSRLQAMQRILEEYDDKWRPTDAEGARYEVDLPDGGTEGVRTKDDVRRVLFERYH